MRTWLTALGIIGLLALLTAQVNTYVRVRIGGGASGKLAEVDSSGQLLVTTTGTAAAATDPSVNTFPRIRIAGGTSGNLAEVDSTGHLLVSGVGGASFSDSAGLAAALSDETGSGAAVFASGPTFAGLVRHGTGDTVGWNTSVAAQSLWVKLGTSASPNTTTGPPVRVDRFVNLDSGDIIGDGAEELASIYGAAENPGAGSGQPVGVLGIGKYTGSSATGDGLGVYGIGYSSQHVGIGGFFFGRGQCAACEANGVEAVVHNRRGAAVTWDATDGRPTMAGIWINAYKSAVDTGANQQASAAITVNNSYGAQFDVGIGFSAASNGGFTGGIANYTIYDASTSVTSLNIQGTHTTAIVTGSTAGTSAFGTASSTTIRLLAALTDNTNDAAGIKGTVNQATAAAGTIQAGVWGTSTAAHTTGSHGRQYGVRGNGFHTQAGTSAWIVGVEGESTTSGSGGTITDLVSVLAGANTVGGSTTVTRNQGLHIAAQTGGADTYQLRSVGTAKSYFAGPVIVDMPAVQTIAGGDTITADACGSLKRVTAAGAVTTSTTNTFTAPAAANSGCVMHVCNTGANTITLDNNANFFSTGASDVALGANDCILVGSTGASGAWYALAPISVN